MFKRQRTSNSSWNDLPAVLIRCAVAQFCDCFAYTNASVACKSWKAALEENADLRRPWIVTRDIVVKTMGMQTVADVAEYFLRHGVRAFKALTDRHDLFIPVELAIVPARFRHIAQVYMTHDKDGLETLNADVDLDEFVIDQLKRTEPSREAMLRLQRMAATVTDVWSGANRDLVLVMRRLMFCE